MTKIQHLPRDSRVTWVTLGNPASSEGEVFYAENSWESQPLGTSGQVGERLAMAIARRQEPGSGEGRSHAQRPGIPALGKGTRGGRAPFRSEGRTSFNTGSGSPHLSGLGGRSLGEPR